MRQLITRLDDDLHARVKSTARAEGRSVNALVVEALERAVHASVDHRATLRRRARDAGLLVLPSASGAVPLRDDVIASTRGAGSAVSEALAAERDGA